MYDTSMIDQMILAVSARCCNVACPSEGVANGCRAESRCSCCVVGKSTCCRVLSLAMNLLYKRISPGSMFPDDNLSTNHTGVSRRSQKLQVCIPYSYLTSGASVK